MNKNHNNGANSNNTKINNANKKAVVVDLTGDDEKTPTAKTINKIVTPVTTGTRIMLMPYVTTNMKSPMVLKLNAGITNKIVKASINAQMIILQSCTFHSYNNY